MNQLTLYLTKLAIKSGLVSDTFRVGYTARNEILYGDNVGSPQDTRELINSYIPTEEQVKDNFFVGQALEEGVNRALGVFLPVPIKIAWEVYTLYDYFD
jgi:hypothetical protein